jgi:enterochelin esterase family protein
VYTSPDYSPDGAPYGLVLLFDGEAYLRDIPVPTILDNLHAAGHLPPLVAVLVGNPDGDPAVRMRELLCPPPLVDFVMQELLPWAAGRYQITADPGSTVIAGQSAGGLAAAFCALRHSDRFGNVLSLSGSFWWTPGWQARGAVEDAPEPGRLIHEYLRAGRLPLRFYLTVGLMESAALTRDIVNLGLPLQRHMRDVLRAKGYEVLYREFNGGHDRLGWRANVADGLVALIGSGQLQAAPARQHETN